MDRKKRQANPLAKRVFRELIGDWRKYLVLFLLLSITIGFVSGMFVANSSMLKAENDGIKKYKMEYGHFELNEKPDAELLEKIASGDKTDVWAYAVEEGRKEADKEIEEKAGEQAAEQAEKMTATGVSYEDALKMIRESAEYKDAIEKARNEAYEKIDQKISEKKDEEEAKKTEKEKQQEKDFFPVPIRTYELFYKNLDQSKENDGTRDAKIRVYKVPEEIDLACVMEIITRSKWEIPFIFRERHLRYRALWPW